MQINAMQRKKGFVSKSGSQLRVVRHLVLSRQVREVSPLQARLDHSLTDVSLAFVGFVRLSSGTKPSCYLQHQLRCSSSVQLPHSATVATLRQSGPYL